MQSGTADSEMYSLCNVFIERKYSIVNLRRFEWISLPSTQKLTFVWVTNFVLFTFVPHFFLPRYTQFFIQCVPESFRPVINLSQLYRKQIYAHKKLSLEYKVYLVKMNRKKCSFIDKSLTEMYLRKWKSFFSIRKSIAVLCCAILRIQQLWYEDSFLIQTHNLSTDSQ